MLGRVAGVRTAPSEERIASIVRVTAIGELGIAVALTSNRSMLLRNTLYIVFLRSVLRLLITANIVPCSPILVTLMMEAIRYSETSVLTRATRRNIPEDSILHSHCRENLKSYKSYFPPPHITLTYPFFFLGTLDEIDKSRFHCTCRPVTSLGVFLMENEVEVSFAISTTK
jgi:hypothetical protein